MSCYEDFWCESHDGLKLYARDYGNSAPLATIVCIPGLTRNSADFAPLCERLAKHYRVIAVDLRGRGKSDYDSEPNNYFPGVYATDMMTLLDALSLESVILLGTSLGGLVSMLMTAMHPERITAVMMNDIGPEANPKGIDRIKAYVCAPSCVSNWDDAVSRTRSSLAEEYPDFQTSDWENFTNNLYRESASGVPVLSYDPAIAQPLLRSEDNAVPPDLWPIFKQMSDTPLLVLRGEHSDILMPESVTKMQQNHPNMLFAEIPLRGHTPLLSEKESLQAIDLLLNSL